MAVALAGAAFGAALGAVLSPTTNSIAARIMKILDEKRALSKDLKNNISAINSEFQLICRYLLDNQLSTMGDPSNVMLKYMENLRELSFDIDDCMDRLLHCSQRPDDKLMKIVKDLAERAVKLRSDMAHYNVNGNQASTSNVDNNKYTVEEVQRQVIGISDSKKELRELLNAHSEMLIVVSVVGFSGSGKTTLAKAVYNEYEGPTAWVDASDHKDDTSLLTALLEALRNASDHKDDTSLLTALLEALHISENGSNTRAKASKLEDATKDVDRVDKLAKNTTDFLPSQTKKRCLIVIDDIQEQQWNCIESVIPEATGSRIIVTTTRQEVARLCCGAESDRRRGYVYNMKNLDESHSMELIKTVMRRTVLGLEKSSSLIMNKCDGHPLSLVTVAKYLRKRNEFEKTHFENFWNKLGDHMKDDNTFGKLQQVLLDNYSSLPDRPVNLKTCLMYTCVFPNGHPIKRTRLLRRWLAEGYVTDPDPYRALLAADDHLEILIDRNIIRLIHSSKNSKVKTCQTHGIMHEFMQSMAMLSTNKLISSVSNSEKRDYRHLFSERQPSSSSVITSGDAEEKLRAHSLTICGSAGEAVEVFSKCELLRVLDLEECSDLKDEHIDCIPQLWHLKYLSLGTTISRIPRKINGLHCLETLDIRKTKIQMLPMEVFQLPNLTRLLGKFKLQERGLAEASELKEFETQKSNLQTLTGFVTDDDPGSSLLMIRMKKLRKVKIWCDSLGDQGSQSSVALLLAIQQFVEVHLETGGDVYHSLSLELGNYSEVILGPNGLPLNVPSGYLSSLKLHGALKERTRFVALLTGLKELCLSSTNDLTQKELSELGNLEQLVYLKLVKVSLKDFVIESKDFPILRRLCLVQCQSLPTIKQGALPDLLSLRLLNQGLDGLSGIKIEQHKHLQELALDSDVDPKTIRAWEDAAKKHTKRPRVLFFKRVDVDGTGSVVKYVATCRPSPEMEASSVVEGSTDPGNASTNTPIDFAGGTPTSQMPILPMETAFCIQ